MMPKARKKCRREVPQFSAFLLYVIQGESPPYGAEGHIGGFSKLFYTSKEMKSHHFEADTHLRCNDKVQLFHIVISVISNYITVALVLAAYTLSFTR